jgi:hypothetical protein
MTFPMTETPDSPRWDLLPHDPEGFFELESGYDRTTLKRAYNRYLKQFKPDKFPEEFQRIRAAYESLDQELRYGARESRGPGLRPYRWNPGSDAETEPARPQSGPDAPPGPSADRPDPLRTPPPPPPLHARLAQEAPESLYEELKRKPEKSPYDYFGLALIGDALPAGDDLRFLKWLLAGLKDHPRDPALFHLLYEYVRTALPPDAAARALLAISQVVQGDRFYYLTEPVWDGLLNAVPFKSFRETLKACEMKQPVHEVFGRKAFYLHLLRKALWRADDDWLTHGFALLDEAGSELPHSLEWDLEVLTVLRSYREQREQFLDGSSLRNAVDRVLKIYCEEDDEAVERAFLTFQLRAASDAEEVLEAFPFDDEENDPCVIVWQAWCWIEAEVGGRLGLDRSGEELQPKQKRSMRRWLEAMEARGNSSLGGQVWDMLSLGVSFAQMAASALVFFLVFSLIFLIWPTAPTLVVFLDVVVSGVAAWLGGRLIFQRFVVPWWKRYCRLQGRKIYVGIWRQEFVSYLQQTRLRFGAARELMADRYDERLQVCSWLLRYSQNDFGLAFYATALQYAA